MKRRRFVQVGVGSRGQMYSEGTVEGYPELCELVGLCDSNEGRLRLRSEWARSHGANPKEYLANQFDQMISECEPDCVIVTTRDCFHSFYVCRAMELGCDVIVEKPMAADEIQCQQILDMQRMTGKKCTVTFNMRYEPTCTQIKDILMSGAIGDVLSVDFRELLNTRHGADYFRRWHRNKANSGGLLVHKATHHFDAVNWWLSDIPVTIYGAGHRRFFTPHQAARYGLKNPADRCLGCPESGKCPFFWDMSQSPMDKALYLDQERYDGYHRDSCVFSPETDIEDSLALTVSYKSGAKLSYSLDAFSPWEGLILAFNGSRGRLELKHMAEVDARGTANESVSAGDMDATIGGVPTGGTTIFVYPHFKEPYAVEPWRAEGNHGGADPQVVADLFGPTPAPDKYLRSSDQRAGAYSILTGIAGNISIATGKPIRIDDLVENIGLPEFPPMPSADEPISLD